MPHSQMPPDSSVSQILSQCQSLQALSKIVQAQAVVLIGSAPGLKLTPRNFGNALVVCVNGAAFGVEGEFVADITFMNTSVAASREAGVPTRARLGELQTRHLLIVESGLGIEQALPAFEPVRRGSTLYFPLAERTRFLEAFLGKALSGPVGGDHVPSTGFVACLILLACGAAHITMYGFSFEDGHSYIAEVFKRAHVARDKEVLDFLRANALPVTFPVLN